MNLKIPESNKVVEEKEDDEGEKQMQGRRTMLVQAVVPAVQAVVQAVVPPAAAPPPPPPPPPPPTTTCPWEPQFAPDGPPMMQRCIRAKLVASTVMGPTTLPLMTETKERVVH